MLGLLEKARQLKNSLGFVDGREEIAFDADSGITREEQKEIRAEIEKVATSSRITVKPEMFAVKAAKRGVLFPVIVNVGALLVLAVGLALFYFLFQRGETQLARWARKNQVPTSGQNRSARRSGRRRRAGSPREPCARARAGSERSGYGRRCR
jgi:hypothetical protein